MYGNEQQGYGHYQQSDLAIQAAAANPHQLVLMLFNGLMDELVRAKATSPRVATTAKCRA